MKIATDEELQNAITPIIEEALNEVTDKAYKLLIEHINTDTYRIGKNITGKSQINKSYMDGTGTPSYEFRDKAWVKSFTNNMAEYIFSIIYVPDNMKAPSSAHPYEHGNYSKGEDRREILAELLNISGISSGDFEHNGFGKEREPFWDNFIEELNSKIGQWTYTSFNKRGLNIPSLKYLKNKFND